MTSALVTVVLLALTRDPKYEEELRARLEAISAEAVPIFQQGTEAYDKRDQAQAATLFQKVTELAPNFDAGHRRLCYALVHLGKHEDAERECRRALELGPDAWQNELSMAA